MSPPRPPASPVAPVVARFLALKTALGRDYARERAILHALDAFLTGHAPPPADLTPETFTRWGQTLQRLTPGVRRHWLRTVRNLCLYRRRTEPACFVPDPALFPVPHQPVTPYLFSPAEIARLLQLADRLPPTPRSPLRPAAYRLALVLLYTTGLRRGELLRLTVGDYDPREQSLLVCASKFHKARCLPLAPDGAREVERYLAARRAHRLPVAPALPLLWCGSAGERPYTGEGFGHGFRCLCRAAGIRTPTGGTPRVHDLRHSFAVQALVRWYRAGADVQAKLPLLATYLGHVSIVSTQYYLHFIDPLAAAASEQFARGCGALVLPAPGGAGGA